MASPNRYRSVRPRVTIQKFDGDTAVQVRYWLRDFKTKPLFPNCPICNPVVEAAADDETNK